VALLFLVVDIRPLKELQAQVALGENSNQENLFVVKMTKYWNRGPERLGSLHPWRCLLGRVRHWAA